MGRLGEPALLSRFVQLLLGLAMLAAIITALTWATGGVRWSLLGLRISSSSVLRPFVVGALACLALLATTGLWPSRAIARVTLPASLLLCAAFTWWHAAPYAAAADMYGYVSQARDWQQGSLVHEDWVRDRGGFPVASAVPLGYVLRRGPLPAAVTLYPPGTPLHMALAGLAGDWAMYVVAPLAALAVVLGTQALGRRWFSDDTAAIASLLVAASPILLAQAIVPMSDTLAAAYWIWSLVCATSRRWPLHLAAGACAGLAIAVRPNLAPLVLPLLACSASSAGVSGVLATACGCLPFVVLLGWHNARLFGSALATGYGNTRELFSLAHVSTNARNYFRWAIETMSPLPVVGAIVYLALAARTNPRHLLLGGFIVVNVGLYLVYLPWPNWTFVRFLLPSVPLVSLMATAAAGRLARVDDGRGADRSARPWLLAVLVLTTLGWQLQFTHASELRHTREALARFAELPQRLAAGGLLGEPIVTRLHSGSLRWYAGARTYRWDHMSPAELRTALEVAHAANQSPLFVDDSDDRDQFEARFGPLDCWVDQSQPLLQLQRHAAVRVFRARPGC